jgi:hypothetical protein
MACGTDCFFVARSGATVHIAGTLEQMPHFGDVHSLYLVNALYPENRNSDRVYQDRRDEWQGCKTHRFPAEPGNLFDPWPSKGLPVMRGRRMCVAGIPVSRTLHALGYIPMAASPALQAGPGRREFT